MKKLVSTLMLATCLSTGAAPTRKVIDDGGSGPHKAVAVSEKSLPGFVVYRPLDMKAAVKAEGALPLLVFANGGCNDTSLPYEKMLNDLASYGYLVVALGEMQERIDDRELRKSPNEDMIRAIDWAERQNGRRGGEYYRSVAVEKVTLAGHSCGGAQVMANCGDPRVKSCVMLNSGMGDIEMSGASRESLKRLHAPVLYITGGEGDVAYRNALIDYDGITHVPAAFADNASAGHGGTYHEPFGGSFSLMLRRWMDWRMKSKEEYARVFVDGCLDDFPGFTMKSKGFIAGETWIKSGDKLVFGILNKPAAPKDARQPVAIIAHGFNGTHHSGKNYFETFSRLGYQCFTFDFPCGSVNSRSGNNTREMSVIDEQQALEDIVHYFRQQPDVNPDRIVLVGESQGGLVSALTAASCPDEIHRLILVFPALCIPDNWNSRYRRISDIPEETDLWHVKIGRRFFTELRYLSPYDVIGKFGGSVLIVHGEADKVVPVDYSRRAAETYKDARIHVIHGAGHGFRPAEFREELKAIEDFLKEDK